MIILANFLNSIAVILGIILQTLIILVIVRVILSWVSPDPHNPIVRFIVSVTDPFLRLISPLGRYVNPKGSRIDLLPLVLMLILIFLQSFLVQLLRDYAYQMRQSALPL